MTPEFDRVRSAFAASVTARIAWSCLGRARSSWRTSRFGASMRSLVRHLRDTPRPAAIRTVAIAVAIAAAMQPISIAVMPRTVKPAMPWFAFAAVAVFAAVAAWQPERIADAWLNSRVRRSARS